MQRGSNPLTIVIALLLTAALVGSSAAWMRVETALLAQPERALFIWLLVASEVFLLVTRAFREWRDRA